MHGRDLRAAVLTNHELNPTFSSSSFSVIGHQAIVSILDTLVFGLNSADRLLFELLSLQLWPETFATTRAEMAPEFTQICHLKWLVSMQGTGPCLRFRVPSCLNQTMHVDFTPYCLCLAPVADSSSIVQPLPYPLLRIASPLDQRYGGPEPQTAQWSGGD